MSNLQTYLAGKDRVKAVQWNTNGDHPLDKSEYITLGTETDGEPDIILSEGKFVKKFRHPHISERDVCDECGYTMNEHGMVDSNSSTLKVCPGDYVVTNEVRDTYATKPEEFEANYRLEIS